MFHDSGLSSMTSSLSSTRREKFHPEIRPQTLRNCPKGGWLRALWYRAVYTFHVILPRHPAPSVRLSSKLLLAFLMHASLPWWLSGREFACQCRRHGFDPWVGKIPWRRTWQPTPVFLPWEIPWREKPGGLQSMESQKNPTRLGN